MIVGNPSSDVIEFLLNRGLLSHEAIVDGDVLVVNLKRRHRNYAVLNGKGQSYFVKQIDPFQPFSIQTLQKEACLYALSQPGGPFIALSSCLPKFFFYDANQHTLVLEFIQSSQDLVTYQRAQRQLSLHLAAQLGTVLALAHSGCPVSMLDHAVQSVFQGQIPWAITFHENEPSSVLNLSPANGQFLDILRRYRKFPETLERLKTEWKRSSLIHGDIKFENVLVLESKEEADNRVKLIDWEICDIGDPCWDVGCVLQAYITWWIASVPFEVGITLEQAVDRAEYPLAAIRPAIKQFWLSYCSALKLDGFGPSSLLQHCVSCAGARMLQTVFESMASSSQLSGVAILLLQVSLNILENPERAIQDLLSLEPSA
jgi:hypothetical protein